MVASATRARSTHDYSVVKKQATWVATGLVLIIGLAFTPYEQWLSHERWLYVVNLGLLLAVLIFGRSALGAQRWLKVGPVVIQPSELAKVITVLSFGAYLSKSDAPPRSWKEIFGTLLYILPSALLIFKQPDLGTSLVLPVVAVGMLYMAGAPGTKLATMICGALALVGGLIWGHFRYGIPLPFHDYQLKRVAVLFDPSLDPLGAGYHIRQSIIALGSGKLVGKGIFMGDQSQLKFLPEASTDFIYAVIGEELGFLGTMGILLVYLVLLLRMLKIASQAKDTYGRLITAGMMSMLAFHVLVNAGMTMGIMPVVGIPLPFVSAGGSSFLANSIALGIVESVYVHRQKIPF